MSIKRVQKLLFSEYCDFEDMVLIESPFAQTTREGKGLRQVHLGLTPSKLVLATDVLPPVEKSCVNFLPGVDPDIETFELIAIYPIDCVNLSVFRRRKRQTIKAHFCNNRVYYFELGGFQNRTMFWNLWCEKVKFLSPDSGSSHSETSVATSTTNSTLYLVDSKQVVKPNGLTQVWCKFGTGKAPTRSEAAARWTDRYLFLGENFEDNDEYKPIMSTPRLSQFVKPKVISNLSVSTGRSHSRPNEVHIGDYYHINRFGSGISEGCGKPLYLPAEDYVVPRRWSQTTQQSSIEIETLNLDVRADLAEECVRLWEYHSGRGRNRSNVKHRRRYGIAPQPLFLYGLGPWNINPGAKYSIQVKRAVSLVTVRRQPVESELRLPVTKRQLVATVSCDTLRDKAKYNNQLTCAGPRRPIIFFWTPDYWYRPRSARDAYRELQNHLAQLNQYHHKSKRKRKLFYRWRNPHRCDSSDSTDSERTVGSKISHRARRSKQRKGPVRLGVFGRGQDVCEVERERATEETSLQYLKRILRIDMVLTAWDFDSTTLAQQLTMIDRDLFLKVSGAELGVIVSQQSSKNAPNVAAMVAFSHRISCLVASDILRNNNERTRARLIARFITVAEKCHRISNFQSCRTVLFGLQSPAVYRLRSTWAYVRKKHASRYQCFEILCRLYRDPRLMIYQRMFYLSSRTTPYLPFIGDIIAKVLDKIPQYKFNSVTKPARLAVDERESVDKKQGDGFIMKLIKMMNLRDSSSTQLKRKESGTRKGLCDYFKPLDCYEDNRIKCLMEATEFLQQSQLSALHYSFMPNSLASDYLLKARYKEERENFFQSFRVESCDNIQH